jgi:hypothetical protein
MSGRSIKVALAASFAALVTALGAPGALADTGPSCFKIANGSGGFAHGTGVEVRNVDPTAATVVVNYAKTLACPFPGQLWAEWGPGKTDVSYQSTDRVAAGDTGGKFEEKHFRLDGLTPNTFYSVRGGLGYAFQDYRTASEVFRTSPQLARNANIVSFIHGGSAADYRWVFGFDPTIVPSSFGDTYLSVEYGTGDKFQHRSRESRCYPDTFRNRGCKGLNAFEVPGLRDGVEPNRLVRYEARLRVNNTVSGIHSGPAFTFYCNPNRHCLPTT